MIEELFDKYNLNKISFDQLLSEISRFWKVDRDNLQYFLALFNSYKIEGDSALFVIGEEGENPRADRVYPTAIANSNLMEYFPITNYLDLLKEYDFKSSKKVVLWPKKMQAGSGSSVKRTKFLSRIRDISEDKIRIGGKGTDLLVMRDGEYLSLAEFQLIQSILLGKRGAFARLVWHSIVSSETKDSIDELWDKKSIVDKEMSYQDSFKKFDYLSSFGPTLQSYVPVIDESNNISFDRTAPAGHGLFGVEALLAALDSSKLPEVSENEILISSIGNGEDLGSSPDPLITNWMAEKKIPIVMITTTKTKVDLKGGQLALIPRGNKMALMTIVEKAQAEASDQLSYFEELGISKGSGHAYFNTNIVLLNYTILTPLLRELVDKIGEREFQKIITPDLIKNFKQQEIGGEKREFCQLEGALGSVMLNLDRYWRENYSSELIHVLNIDEDHRTRFFAPVKTAFDFFMLYNSDRFTVSDEFRLECNGDKLPPAISITDPIYKEVENVLELFNNCKIKDLTDFDLKGKVDFEGLELRKKVTVESKANKIVKLKKLLGSSCLENIKISINENLEVVIEELI